MAIDVLAKKIDLITSWNSPYEETLEACPKLFLKPIKLVAALFLLVSVFHRFPQHNFRPVQDYCYQKNLIPEMILNVVQIFREHFFDSRLVILLPVDTLKKFCLACSSNFVTEVFCLSKVLIASFFLML